MPKRHLPIILSDRLYVPESLVTKEHKDAYTHIIKRESYQKQDNLPKRCGSCIWWYKPWKDNHGDTQYCHKQGYDVYDLCRDFEYKTLKVVEETEITTYKHLHGKGYYCFARGDLRKLRKTFGKKLLNEAQDDRVEKRLGVPLEFGGKDKIKLRPEQKKLVSQWYEAGGGIIKAPTGSGKATMLTYIICKLGLRTLILAHEERHLTTILAELQEHTNIKELQKQYDYPIVGFFTNHGKYKGKVYPITLATYQIFNSKVGKRSLKKVRNRFGIVWHEEVHHSAAETFYKTTRKFNPKYRGGSTATITRKDQLHSIIYDAIGPVVAEGVISVMPCEVTYIDTNIVINEFSLKRFGQYAWSGLLSILGRSKSLMEMVVLNVIADIQKGLKPLVISERRNFATYLKGELEGLGYKTLLIMGGAKKQKRDDISNPWAPVIKKLNDGDLHCIVGTGVMNEAVNIPPLSSLHLPFPSANPEIEIQRAGRIRRVMPGKPTPQIRVYTFQGAPIASVGCRKTRDAVYRKLGFTSSDRHYKDVLDDTYEAKEEVASKINRKML